MISNLPDSKPIMTRLKKTDGFSLLEVLVAAAIFTIWLPSSLYALQIGLATQLKVQQRAELVEEMMQLQVNVASQWRLGLPVNVDVDDIQWQLQVIDENRAKLHVSAHDYELTFMLNR